jgi:GAF domain-containing protein
MTGPGRERERQALDALDVLVAVAVRLSAAERLAPSNAEAALRAIADAGAAALRVAAASIALRDHASGSLVFRAAAGPHGQGVVGLAIAPHEGIAGYVFSTGQPLAVADVSRDARFERGTAEQTGYVPRSLLAVPLVDAEGIVGVMEWLDRTDGNPFDLEDLEVATRVATAATATARATHLEIEAGRLLRDALASLARAGNGHLEKGGTAIDAVDALLGEVSRELAGHDPLWRLVDRVGQLRDADPDDVDLAVAWLDALIARGRRRAGGGGRTRA